MTGCESRSLSKVSLVYPSRTVHRWGLPLSVCSRVGTTTPVKCLYTTDATPERPRRPWHDSCTGAVRSVNGTRVPSSHWGAGVGTLGTLTRSICRNLYRRHYSCTGVQGRRRSVPGLSRESLRRSRDILHLWVAGAPTSFTSGSQGLHASVATTQPETHKGGGTDTRNRRVYLFYSETLHSSGTKVGSGNHSTGRV